MPTVNQRTIAREIGSHAVSKTNCLRKERTMNAKGCRMLIKLSFLLSGLFLGMLFSSETQAAYPDHAISIVVPYPAGGLSDLGARIIAESMEKHLKQPVVVVNKVGGGGTVGGYAVATAKPDGYTLGFFAIQTNVPELYSYFSTAPYTSADLRPIASIHTAVQGWVVKAETPWNTLKDFVEFARKNPGQKIGHPGKNTGAYHSLVTVANAEKIQLVDVPYQGDTPIVPAIVGDHIPVGILGIPAVRSLLEAKKVRVLALNLLKRAEFVPDVPTMVELGYKFTIHPYLGLVGPKGTPDEAVKKIDEVLRKVSEEQDVRTKSSAVGLQVIYLDNTTYPKTITQDVEGLRAFFKEQGMLK